jgi:hypothetical protein
MAALWLQSCNLQGCNRYLHHGFKARARGPAGPARMGKQEDHMGKREDHMGKRREACRQRSGGTDGNGDSAGDNTLFAVQGAFAP